MAKPTTRLSFAETITEIENYSRSALEAVWMQAYTDGAYVRDFSVDFSPGEAKLLAFRFHRRLRDWYTLLKRKNVDRQKVWQMAQQVSLKQPKNGAVAMRKKQVSHTGNSIAMRPPESPKTILEKMREKMQKELA